MQNKKIFEGEEIATGEEESKYADLLEYYHIDSVEEFVEIMMSMEKSHTYNRVRVHPIPHVDIQNFSTIKSSMQYKRQLLLTSLQETHSQVKDKITK